jgi:Na+/melibiose symporter-like transporter
MPLVAIAAAAFVPDGDALQRPRIALRAFIGDIARNLPFWWFLAVAVPSLVAIGANMALGYIFITQYLGLGGSYTLLALPATFAPLLAVPVWLPFAKWFQRQGAWAISLGVAAAASAVLGVLPPSPSVQLVFFIALTTFSLAAGGNWLGAPMLGDVADYDELRSGANKTGFYFAFFSLLNKVALAVGSGAALLIVGLAGVKTGVPMDAQARTGLLIAYAWLPFGLNLLAIPAALRFPLTRAHQQVIRARLLQRRAQAAAS